MAEYRNLNLNCPSLNYLFPAFSQVKIQGENSAETGRKDITKVTLSPGIIIPLVFTCL